MSTAASTTVASSSSATTTTTITPPPPVHEPNSSVDTATTTNTNSNRFDISQLPSLQKDGMTMEQEALQRRKTCRFIEEAAGRVLKLPRVAIATAMVLFHRFYAKHCFSEHDRFEVAVASIVLAAKTEESPKKLNTVLQECYKLKQQGIKAGRISTTGSSSHPSSSSNNEMLDLKSEEFCKLKERVLLLERVILHTIGFELSIDHPYKFLLDTIRSIVLVKPCIEFITTPTTTMTSQEITKRLNTQLGQM